jgi:hypothetical protein
MIEMKGGIKMPENFRPFDLKAYKDPILIKGPAPVRASEKQKAVNRSYQPQSLNVSGFQGGLLSDGISKGHPNPNKSNDYEIP